jgi:hypothetical protein
MPFAIEQEILIDAPADQVWAVVSDLARYPEWNPFVVSCTSTLVPGDPIAMRVRIFARFAQPQRETILEHEPGRWLCYGLPPSRLGALASRRSHEVSPAGASRARYVSHFELSGWLAPLVEWLLGARLRAGFGAMSAALQARAEALAGTRNYSGA